MIVADVELVESFFDADLDICCLGSVNGDDTLKDACL